MHADIDQRPAAGLRGANHQISRAIYAAAARGRQDALGGRFGRSPRRLRYGVILPNEPIESSAMKLEGKGAIVTGAGSGIGQAVARLFASEGAEVVTVGRTPQKLERAKASADTVGRRLHPYPADIGDASAVDGLVAWAIDRLPQIDILVNNAGINVTDRAFAKVSREDFDAVVRVNLNGPFYLMQAVLPGMRERGDGVVITVSSVGGLRASVVTGAAYGASKHGVRALSLTGHLEEGANGIRCCVINPGEVDTPFLEKRSIVPSSESRALMLQPEDVADAALFVATLHPRAAIPELVITPAVQAYP